MSKHSKPKKCEWKFRKCENKVTRSIKKELYLCEKHYYLLLEITNWLFRLDRVDTYDKLL